GAPLYTKCETGLMDARSIGDDGVRALFRRSHAGNNRQDVGLHLVPLLNQQTLGLEKLANQARFPADNLFQDGNEDGQCAVADHGTLGDGRKVLVLGNGNGETIAPIHVKHDMDVGAAVADVHNALGPGPKVLEQLVNDGHLAVSCSHLKDSFDFAVLVVFKFRAVDMIGGDNAFQGRADHFHRASRDHVEIEVVALNFIGKEAVEQVNIRLQAHPLARLVQMLRTDLGAKLGVVQQQVGEFAALLHQVQLRHPGGLAFEFCFGDTQQLGQDISRVVKAEGLVKIAGEYESLLRMYSLCHAFGVGLMVLLV